MSSQDYFFAKENGTVMYQMVTLNILTNWQPMSLSKYTVKQELNFHDKDTQFYRFMEAEFDLNNTTNEKDSKDDELQESLSLLVQMGPDALLTMILRKW